MARNYTFQFASSCTASSTIALGYIFNITAINQFRIYDILSGSDASPIDQAAKFQLVRASTTGNTLTVGSAFGINPADPVPTAFVYTNPSNPGGTSPTMTGPSSLLTWAQNQRATFRWVAAPEREIYSTIGSIQNGFGTITPVISGSNWNCVLTEEFTE